MQLRKGIGFPSSCRELVPYRRPIAWRDPNGFYRLLGLTPAASDSEIRRSGRRLLALHHPDGPEPDEEKFLCVQEAYRTLSDRRHAYDSMTDGQFMVTHDHKDLGGFRFAESGGYRGWSYFSELPRVSDDEIATLAYEKYLHEALRMSTSLPCIAVALIQGRGNPWIDDGLIYVPVSDIGAILAPTSETSLGPQDKADKGHVNI